MSVSVSLSLSLSACSWTCSGSCLSGPEGQGRGAAAWRSVRSAPERGGEACALGSNTR